jgi:uncharacterized repeat protein (TIGR03843 family)
LNADPLLTGELSILGQLVDASNATLLCEISNEHGGQQKVIYKPLAGERPLWDFPEGHLAHREVAAYLLSEFLTLGVIPKTILREGPFGLGSVQEWIDVDISIDVASFADSRDADIRKIAFLDILMNNTDRKFGHLLPAPNGRIFGCDHGLTFHTDNKLRTVLWQFSGERLTLEEIEVLEKIKSDFDEDLLRLYISSDEIEALLQRSNSLLTEGIFPFPSTEWPAVPWPPF